MNSLDKYTDKEYLESEVAKKKAKDDGKEVSDYTESKDSLFKRGSRTLKKTVAGSNTAGKVIGVGLDVFTFFAPAGSKIDSLRKKGKQALNLNENKNDMKDAIKGIFQKDAWKRILNFKDGDGNFSPQEALTTVVQSAFIIGLLYAAQKLGILEPLLALLGLG